MATQATAAPIDQGPEPQTVEAADARQRFDALIDRVAREGDRVVVERDGKPVAVLVSTTDLERLRAFDAVLVRRKQLLAEIREPFKDIPAEEIEREVANAVAAVRARRRAERTQADDVTR